MQTKSYQYNEAIRELAKDIELSRLDCINFITDPTNKEEPDTIAYNDKESAIEKSLNPSGFCNIYNVESKQAEQNIKSTGAFPYNSVVAEELLRLLGINDIKNYKRRAEHIVYGTNRHFRNHATVQKHEEAIAQGYTSIADITPEQNSHKAILLGKKDNDIFGSIDKTGAIIKLLKTDQCHGYQNPRQSRKYFNCQDELFFKLI